MSPFNLDYMADITNANDVALSEFGTTLLYIPAGDITENFNVTNTTAGTLELPDNSSLGCTLLTSPNTNVLELDLGTGGEVIQTTSSNGNAASWQGGTIRADGKEFVANHTAGNHQWPGFASSTAAPYNIIVPNCTFRLGPNALGAIAGGTTGIQLTNHFQGIARTGNNFNGVRFANGAIITPYEALPFVNVTFSPDVANDGASSTGQAYVRMMQTREAGRSGTAVWTGFFGCDHSQWTGDDPVAFQAVANSTSATALDCFVIDGTYSAEWLTSGFQTSRTRTDLITTTVKVGRSWNPRFLDLVNNSVITDMVINFGANEILLPGTVNAPEVHLPVNTAFPSQAATNGGNYLDWYMSRDADNRRTGVVIIEAEDEIDANVITTTALSNAARNYEIRTYSHLNYSPTDGTVSTVQAESGTWTGLGVMNNAVEAQHAVRLSADNLLNGNDLARAEVLNSDVGQDAGTGDIRNAYAMAKERFYSTRVSDVGLSTFLAYQTVDINNFNLGTGALTLANAVSTLSTTAMTLHTNPTLELNNGSITCGALNATTAVTLNNGTLNTSSIDLNNLTIGTGVTIDATTVSNVAADTFNNATTFSGTVVFNDPGTVSITSWNTTGDFQFSGTGSVSMTFTQAQNVFRSDGTTRVSDDASPDGSITYVVETTQRVTFSRDVNYLLGRLRGGTYSVVSAEDGAGRLNPVELVTGNELVVTSGIDGWLANDTIVIYYTAASDTNGNTNRYLPTRLDINLTEGSTSVTPVRVPPVLLDGIDGVFTPNLVNPPSFTHGDNDPLYYVEISVDVGQSLDLVNTKAFALWVAGVETGAPGARLLEAMTRSQSTIEGNESDAIAMTINGVFFDERLLSFSKPAAANQHALTGVVATAGTLPSGALNIDASPIANSATAIPTGFLIDITGNFPDFQLTPVPTGITLAEVVPAVSSLGLAQQADLMAARNVINTIDTNVNTVDGKVDVIDGIVDNIVADTNEMQLDLVDGGRLDTIFDNILADTNELQGDFVDGGRLDVILDDILADTNELQVDFTNDGRLDVILDDILADTNELQTDWVNDGRLDIILDTINTNATTLAGRTDNTTVIGNIDNKVSYLVTTGHGTTNAKDRLGGIRPKADLYYNDTDYTTVADTDRP